MIDVERTDFVAVPTRDRERAAAFYGETLGLRKNQTSDTWIEFETGNLTLSLVAPEEVGIEFAPLPFGVRSVAPPLVRRMMLKQLHAQGTGRHSSEEIVAIGKADLTAFSRILGDRSFTLGGESPTTVDCTAYGFLAQLMLTGFDGPLQEHVRGLKNLEPYVKRIRDKWWAA